MKDNLEIDIPKLNSFQPFVCRCSFHRDTNNSFKLVPIVCSLKILTDTTVHNPSESGVWSYVHILQYQFKITVLMQCRMMRVT